METRRRLAVDGRRAVAWSQIRALAQHPAFAPISAKLLEVPATGPSLWPSPDDFNRLWPAASGIRFVDADADASDLHYEEAIVQRGVIATRRNAHDSFNALVWLTFPKTKHAISLRHAKVLADGGEPERKRRSPERDALTLFDEGGAIVLASDDRFINALRRFDWATLFVAERSALAACFKVLVFGHATYEKLCDPYVGITCKALPFVVRQDVIEQPLPHLIASADQLASHAITYATPLSNRRTFTPLPILGMPGWYPDNETPVFYENRDYFRAGYEPTRKLQRAREIHDEQSASAT